MLKDFYPTKELTLEQKNKYDEQIENLKKQNKIRDKFLKVLLKKQGITEKDFEDLDVKQQVANLS